MPRRQIDFALLTDPPASGYPRFPVVGPLLGYVSAQLLPSRWGTVRLVPSGAPPASGDVLLATDLRHCMARARQARRLGAGLVGLGGSFARNPQLAAAVARDVGLSVTSGESLEAVGLLEAALVLLRWRGVDPARARAVVVADREAPALGEALAELLGDRAGCVGVLGLEGPRRLRLADRMRCTSGAALEVYRTPEHCLAAADLLVLTGGPRAVDPEACAGNGGDRSLPGLRTSVVIDLRATGTRGGTGGGAGGGVRGGAGAGAGRGSTGLLRLAGLSPESLPGTPRDGAAWPVAHNLQAGGPRAEAPFGLGEVRTPLRVGEVRFQTPAGWHGRPEPGAPAGLASASLAEVIVFALAARATGRSAAKPFIRPSLRPDRLAWLYRRALALGFRPAAVGVRPPSPFP